MPISSQLARRTLIKAGAAVGAVVALTLTTSTSALAKVGDLPDTRRKILDRFTARKNRTYSGRRTANGWEAELRADAGGGVERVRYCHWEPPKIETALVGGYRELRGARNCHHR